MEKYRILFTKSSAKELSDISRKDTQRILRRTSELSENPKPMGCEKLSGKPLYRIRQGDYRIIYCIDDTNRIVDIIKIGHRHEIYRF